MDDCGAPSSLGYEPDEPSIFDDQAPDDLVHTAESVADSVSLFSALPADRASEVEGVEFNFRNALLMRCMGSKPKRSSCLGRRTHGNAFSSHLLT